MRPALPLSLLAPLAVAAALAAPAPLSAQTLEAQLAGGDAGFGDLVGEAVDVGGDTIVAGARAQNGGVGAAYVFRRTAGTWAQEAKLTAAGALAEDQVGAALAVDGDVVVLGAPDPFDLFGAASGPGTGYVFRRTGTTWSQEAALAAGDGQGSDELGAAVGVSGDAAVVGAPGDEPSGAGNRLGGRGAAYVFRHAGGGAWPEEAKLMASDGAAGDRFGAAASIDGDFAVVGAPAEDDAGADSGSAYVFRRTGGTNWTQDGKLTAGDGAAGDAFGGAVAISGDAVLVGAPFADAGAADSGAVYVFRRSGGAWLQEAKLTASDVAADGRYGFSVDLFGDEAVAGATGTTAAYFVERSGGSWSETAKLSDASTSLLGYGVAVSDDFLVAGAPLTSGGGASFVGVAEVWCTNPGPVLDSIAPTSGLFHANTTVTLTGSSFSSVKATTVTFGGVPATGVTWVSPTELTCVAPSGTQGQVVDVVVDQEGDTSTLVGAFTYVGTEIAAVTPPSGPSVGGPPVTITGQNFVDDGSTAVTFGGVAATVVLVTEPDTIVVDVPPGTRGTTVDVSVTSTNGADTLANGWTYQVVSILGADVAAANLTGGTTITIDVDFPTTLGDTAVTLDGAPVTVTAVTASTVQFTTPGVVEPDAAALDIGLTNSNGSATLPAAFTYSPALFVAVTGDTASGGTLELDWLTDETVAGPQTFTLWLGHPTVPPLNAPLFGYSGLIQALPYFFVLNAVPATSAPLSLPFGPLPPTIAGFPLRMQALVTGEGDVMGSLSNDAVFAIP